MDGSIGGIVCLFLSQGDKLTTNPYLGNFQGCISFRQYQIFPGCDQPGAFFDQMSEDMATPSRKLCHNILDSLTSYANCIGHVIYSQSLVVHHHKVNTINFFP